jgi:hypothetical protein
MIKYALVLCFIAVSLAAGPTLRPMQAYATCDVKDFRVEQVDYLQQPVERNIETADGVRTVVMVEGARILVSYKDRPFLNLKAERFSKESFSKDKEIQIKGLTQIAAGSQDMDVSGLQPTRVGNLTIYQIQRKKMEGGVLSVVLAIDEPNRVMMTGYFLNDDPGARVFKTLDEFHTLRDNYIKALNTCLLK